MCGVNQKHMEVHHIVPLKNILKEFKINTIDEALLCNELWEINNGITLCRKCHTQTIHKESNFIEFFQQRNLSHDNKSNKRFI